MFLIQARFLDKRVKCFSSLCCRVGKTRPMSMLLVVMVTIFMTAV